jgi:hypothetical protein
MVKKCQCDREFLKKKFPGIDLSLEGLKKSIGQHYDFKAIERSSRNDKNRREVFTKAGLDDSEA